MKNRHILISILLMTIAGVLFAGDIATFVNLGFSEDSGYFMFGQYGIVEKPATAYADLYLVDVPRNSFVPDGVKSESYSGDIHPGQDGSGAFYALLTDHVQLKREYRINPLKQGRILYLLVNGQEPKSQLEFRDFVTGNTYRINLVQTSRGSGKDIRSSFYIQLSLIRPDNGIKAYTVGRPDYMRNGVRQYRIRQILLSPDQKSLVFVIEKETVDETGTNVRYMVETVFLK